MFGTPGTAIGTGGLDFEYMGTCEVADHPTIRGAKIVTCKSTGCLSVYENARLARILVAGGGGGGGNGGGGAGAAIDRAPQGGLALPKDTSYVVTIGRGGAGATTPNDAGGNGTASSFAGLWSANGGCGGAGFSQSRPSGQGLSSVGGGAASTTADYAVGGRRLDAYGHASGAGTNQGQSESGCGGGGVGGGAGGDAADSGVLHVENHNDATVESAGDGGAGLESDITGETRFYAGGGGGGVRRSNFKHGGAGGSGVGGRGFGATPGAEGPSGFKAAMSSPLEATAGAASTGSGGGGSGWDAAGNAWPAGDGADGVAILVLAPAGADISFDRAKSACAVGGIAKTVGKKAVHVFIEDGTFTARRELVADVLLVGGGGAGGDSSGGGGGAGGVLYAENVTIPYGTHQIRVGAGGTPTTSPDDSLGGDGGDSSIGSLLTAKGGGGGAGWGSAQGRPGGSSGGSTSSSTTVGAPVEGQGHAGGIAGANAPAGGGGAGAAGHNGVVGTTFNDGDGACGGDGLAFDITGEEVWYGGGGGAGGSTAYYARGLGGKGGGGSGAFVANEGTTRVSGWPGAAYLGGGGGGGSRIGGIGAAGGSGIVVIRYALPPAPTVVVVK